LNALNVANCYIFSVRELQKLKMGEIPVFYELGPFLVVYWKICEFRAFTLNFSALSGVKWNCRYIFQLLEELEITWYYFVQLFRALEVMGLNIFKLLEVLEVTGYFIFQLFGALEVMGHYFLQLLEALDLTAVSFIK